ncbi:MAG: protoporphyrinogen oxidase [Thermodesulfobacteriota bacterium]
MKKVVIIGGGIAGLATAYSLCQEKTPEQELEIVILEAAERAGGHIQTETEDGFIVEGGPDCFISEKPWAIGLCRKLGLNEKLLPTNDRLRKTFVLSRGKLHELPEGVILMIPTKIMPLALSTLISTKGKLRMLLEIFIPKKKDNSDESLGDFVRRRLGAEVLDKIAEPLVAGIHAADPDTMSVRSSFPKFVQLEEEYGSLIRGMVSKMAHFKKSAAAGKNTGGGKKMTMFVTLRDGMQDLIETLIRDITKKGVKIRTNTAVKGLEKTKNSRLRLTLNEGRNILADAVVIAAPAHAASVLVHNLDKELSGQLGEITFTSTATVTMAFKKKDLSKPLTGFGFVVPRSEKRGIMASTWSSVKFDGRAPEDSVLIRCFVGGAKSGHLLDLDDTEMTEMVRGELKDILGITAPPLFTRIFRWMKAMPQYTIGHQERVQRIEESTARHPGLFLTGSSYHGIGIPDSIHGGEITAQKILSLLKKKTS